MVNWSQYESTESQTLTDVADIIQVKGKIQGKDNFNGGKHWLQFCISLLNLVDILDWSEI